MLPSLVEPEFSNSWMTRRFLKPKCEPCLQQAVDCDDLSVCKKWTWAIIGKNVRPA